MPKVSIIIPNYNYAHYLDERISGILCQTFTDFELIILDDASVDESISVIEKYTHDKRVKTIYFKKNSGLPYKRWNDGASAATGKYFLFAGADDHCEPNLVETLTEKLDFYSTAGIAFCQSWEVDGYGNRMRTLDHLTDRLDKNRWRQDFFDKGTNELMYLSFQNTIPNASAVMIRSDEFMKAGMFDEKFTLSADWLLWIKILINSDLAYSSKTMNYFRTHHNTIRRKSKGLGIQIAEHYEILKFLLANSDIRYEDIEPSLVNLARKWARRTYKRNSGISLEQNLRIYKSAVSVDRNIRVRMLGKLFDKLIGRKI